MDEADIITATVTLLKSDAAVTALCADRVFGDELPNDEAAAMPRAAIVVRASGGTSIAAGSFIQHDTQRLDLVAYGATKFDADALRRAARRVLTALRRRVIGNVLIHWIESAGGFSSGRDRDGAWPYAFQSFQVFHALQEV
ncbi:tail completion protein gp17 [Nitratireductor soli]|uniref:tail completion protein gp17 n=1 Tax=Nitratireductor soli TaxID=1670619 RepID=UPI00065E988D|nr:DUF3168 domain-containing protein [Nitratireductor soli]